MDMAKKDNEVNYGMGVKHFAASETPYYAASSQPVNGARSSPRSSPKNDRVIGTRFDPETGEPITPINQLPFGTRFHPQTGEPIPKFDPHTGRQNWA